MPKSYDHPRTNPMKIALFLVEAERPFELAPPVDDGGVIVLDKKPIPFYRAAC